MTVSESKTVTAHEIFNTNKLRRKVRRVHWEIPAKIKVYANI